MPHWYGMMPENLPKATFESMLETANSNLRDHPDDLMALLNKGLFLACLDRFDEGFACMDQAAETATREENTHILEVSYLCKGASIFRMNRYKDAIPYFQKALKINPDNDLAYFFTGNTLVEMQKFEDAIPHYDHAIRLKCKFPQVYCKKAFALNCCGKHQAALECLKEVLLTHPDYADAHFEMGNSYMSLEKYRHAIRCHRRAVRADPRHKMAYLHLGISYMLIGQYPIARSYMEKALELAPEDSDVMGALRLLNTRYPIDDDAFW